MNQTPARHHRVLLSQLSRIASGEIDRLMVLMPPGSAKALALDTPIPTPTGWKLMGALRVGDQVFDERGKPCNVTWVSPVWQNRPVYAVRTDCGDTIVADRDHEWPVRLCSKRPVFKNKETWTLERRRSKRPMIRRAEALKTPEVTLPIDPYVLGVWLGDGHSAELRITSSVEDQPWLRAEFARLGYKTSDSSVPTLFGVLSVRKEFTALNLLHDPLHATFGKKHVPPQYLRGSQEQRLALLQGLVDTDGSVGPSGCTTFSNTNVALAKAVRELVRSLGVKATLIEGRAMLYGKDCGPVYRVSFYMRNSARMPRKRALTRDGSRTNNTYIDVDRMGYADTVCIEVDSPSHLFLCGRSMTPTHNSTYCSVLFPAWMFAQRPNLDIIGASHGDELAKDFSGRVQTAIKRFPHVLGYGLKSENVAAWRTSNGGNYRAAGVGGSITGRRSDITILDDVIKGAAEAESQTVRDIAWNWYQAEVYTRLKPGSRIVTIMTRWHPDDLGGRLLEAMNAGGDKWTVLKMPALCDSVHDPLGRQIGEALWPQWQDEAALARVRANVGEHVFGALYQQDPRPRGASFFNIEDLLVDSAPVPMPDKCDTVFAVIDTAVKSGTNHNSTGVIYCSYNSLTKPITTVILDWDVVQIEGAAQADWLPSVYERLEELARQCGARRGSVGAMIEDKATGTVLLQQSANLRAKGIHSPAYPINSKLTSLGKDERAIAAAPYIIANGIKISENAWHKTKVHKGRSANHLISQVSNFRLGAKGDPADDLLDTFTYAVSITHGVASGDRKGI